MIIHDPKSQRLHPARRRASGLVRMLVVGSATLAILLVCFSLYQSWQNEPGGESKPTRQTVRDRTDPGTLQSSDGDTTHGTDTGIGAGKNVSITIYPREGSKAQLEVEVRDWSPLPGAPDQFQLVSPKIRMLTSDNHAVRITADKGTLEAARRSGTSLDPQRGKLSGNVLIEYDRLTEAERAALPPDQAGVLNPAQVVRISMDAIEFDIEYAKLVIPGPLKLTARDVNFSAANLELRFNESENRVETMRITGGGQIELLQVAGAANLSGQANATGTRATVVDWIRQTIQAQLAAQTAAASARRAAEATKRAATVENADAVPVFRAGDLVDDTKDAAVHYFAHFEGHIDAAQRRGDAILARLRADTLDVLRDFTGDTALSPASSQPENQSPATASATPGTATPNDKAPAVEPNETISVSWSDRLVLRAVSSDDKELTDGVRSRVTATGSPVRLSHPEGDAVCRRFVFDPDAGAVWMHGTELSPAVVRQRGQGMLTGTVVHTRTEGETFVIDITGPGQLATATDGPGDGADDATQGLSNAPVTTSKPVANQPIAIDSQVVSFRDRMEARGVVKSKTVFDFTGHVSTKQYRVLKTATFSGQVSVGQKAVAMDADELTVRFGIEESWRGIRQYIDGFHGTGHVVMVQKDDRLSCRELDVSLTTDHTGRIWPLTVIASGDVDAVQGERTIRVRDELIVDFTLYEQPQDEVAGKKPSTVSPPGAAITAEPGEANAPIAVQTKPADPGESHVVRAGVERLRAKGEVHVVDAIQRLDLSAQELDCHIAAQRGEIQTAAVTGTADRPASVRLADVTTIGQRIHVNVPDEWVEIPGGGRMSLVSFRDLDGSSVTEPVPIVITWNTGMRYQGRENRAVFGGGVHAYSRSTTTFDCERLEIEFDEVSQAPKTKSDETASPWHRLPELVDRITGKPSKPKNPARRFNREPAVIWATGNAKAITADIDETTGEMKTRMRIQGPKLAVYLRSEVSKMLIEGGGALLMEQFTAAPTAQANPEKRTGELFDMSSNDGPSKTLIEWTNTMVYDYGIDQTRFEGGVSLKHFSGTALLDRFTSTKTKGVSSNSGRSTYLLSDTLTVDFLERSQRSPSDDRERMGRLSTASLRQFEASGHVRLNDTSEGLQVWADKIIYEKPRQLLAIYGDPTHKARIIKRRPKRLPLQLDVERLFYNLKTGMPEIADLEVR